MLTIPFKHSLKTFDCYKASLNNAFSSTDEGTAEH